MDRIPLQPGRAVVSDQNSRQVFFRRGRSPCFQPPFLIFPREAPRLFPVLCGRGRELPESFYAPLEMGPGAFRLPHSKFTPHPQCGHLNVGVRKGQRISHPRLAVLQVRELSRVVILFADFSAANRFWSHLALTFFVRREKALVNSG